MEVEEGREGDSVAGNSSDSGSGGIIDVSTVSSNFNAPTPQTSGGNCIGEDKRSTAKMCPQSVEKVWFTDTSIGAWLLEEDSWGCEIPDEFLDITIESGDEPEVCDQNEKHEQNSDDEKNEETGSRECDKGNADSSNAAGKAEENQQLCGWVPPQCSLIPLPESPCASEDEREGEREVAEKGRLSQSELERQELEVLFGFKPPPSLPASAKGQGAVEENGAPVLNGNYSDKKDGAEVDVFDEGGEREMVRAAVAKPRSNSTDSGVASISPHSSEGGDVEQRQGRNQTVTDNTGTTSDERAHCKVELSPENPNDPAQGEHTGGTREVNGESGGEGGRGGGGLSSTPERCSLTLCPPVSRLKTPSQKLQKCSVFSGSPVVCSELEELKEASKMTVFPLVVSPTATTSRTCHHTFTVTPPPSTTSPSSHSPTQHSSSSSQHSGKSNTSSHDSSQSGSVSSVASSAASREGANQQKKRNEKRVTSDKLSKPVCRGAMAYKAATGAPPVKVVKRPPQSRLKSRLPASAIPSALPSQVKKPTETKRRTNPPELQNVPEQGRAVAAAMPRKISPPSCTAMVRGSGLVQPGKKIRRRPLDTAGQLRPVRGTFAKPANPNPIKEARGAVIARPSSAGTNPTTRAASNTPTRRRGPSKTKSNPSTPTSRLRGNFKQPNAGPLPPSNSTCITGPPSNATCTNTGLEAATKAPETVVANPVTQDVISSNSKATALSMSIVLSGSPSVQQSTPMKLVSHSRAAAGRAGTIVKAVNRTVTTDTSTTTGGGGQRCGGEIPSTPRSSIPSTPSRRVRPKFSLSSIDSVGSGPPAAAVRQPPPALGDTFTEEPGNQQQPAVQSTPKSLRRNKRRSFIPTPSKQLESRDVPPLVYNCDSNPIGHHDNSPVSRKQSMGLKPTDGGEVGALPAPAGRRRALLPNPRQRRPLVSRNRLAAGVGGGLGKRQPLKTQEGPLKPMNAYKYSSKGFGENSEPPVPTAKMVHSPVNKDDVPDGPHSAWSPIRRKPVAEGEACFQCTKRGYRN